MSRFTRGIFQQLMVNCTNSPTDVEQGRVLQSQRADGLQDQTGLFGRTALAILIYVVLGIVLATAVVGEFTAFEGHGQILSAFKILSQSKFLLHAGLSPIITIAIR